MKRKKNGLGALLRGVLVPVAALCVLMVFTTAVNSLAGGQSEGDLRQLEEALRRGCVACYAAEGVYPPDLDYLEDHYGVQIDDTRYTVHYSVYAENLMPDITVLENEK